MSYQYMQFNEKDLKNVSVFVLWCTILKKMIKERIFFLDSSPEENGGVGRKKNKN